MSIVNSNISVVWERKALVPITTLISQCETVEAILLHPTFLDDLYYFNSSLIEFLAQPAIICELVSYLRVPSQTSKLQYKDKCTAAFCAYSALSCGHTKIIRGILETDYVLEKLFEFVIPNEKVNETAEGYLAGIVKSLLDESNLVRDEVLRHCQKRFWIYIPQFFTNFSRSMSEVIKVMLLVKDPVFKLFQQTLLQKLLDAYFNEQLKCPTETAEECIDNLIAIFDALISNEFALDVKIQISRPLYSDKNIANRGVLERFYRVRILLLVYLAKIKRIKTCEQPLKFLMSYSIYKSSPRLFFLLSNLLEFFRLISENEVFCRDVESGFMAELLLLVGKFPLMDSLHIQILKIVRNLLNDTRREVVYVSIIWSFLDTQLTDFFSQKMNLNTKQEQNKVRPKVSLHILYQLIQFIPEHQSLESCRYSLDQRRQIQATLAERYAQFSVDSFPSNILESSCKNSEILIQNDFAFQGSYAKNYSNQGTNEFHKISFANYQTVFLSQNSQMTSLSPSSIAPTSPGKSSNLTSSIFQNWSIDKLARDRAKEEQKTPVKKSGIQFDESEVKVIHRRDSIQNKELIRDHLLSPLRMSNSLNLVMKQVEEYDSFREIVNRGNAVVKYMEVDMTGSIDPFFGNHKDIAE